MSSNRKYSSVNRCVFTRGTILPNFIPVRLETTEAVISSRRTRRKSTRTRGV